MQKTKFLITIPTLNSGKTLEKCLQSIRSQKYKDYDINIVDSYSTDNTLEITKRFNVGVKMYEGKLLGARYLGVFNEVYDYVLFLDSDQILHESFLQQANSIIQSNKKDMYILEEFTHNPDNWVKRMFEVDKRIVHNEYNTSPEEGVLLPRLFTKDLIDKVFLSIKKSLSDEFFNNILAMDHAIIYYEASKFSSSVDMIPDAIDHMDLNKLTNVFKHFIRWGKYDKNNKPSKNISSKKILGRKKIFLRNFSLRKIYTIPLLATKFLGYYYGYFIASRFK